MKKNTFKYVKFKIYGFFLFFLTGYLHGCKKSFTIKDLIEIYKKGGKTLQRDKYLKYFKSLTYEDTFSMTGYFLK